MLTETNVVTIFPPSRDEAERTCAGCPHCRKPVPIADAAFVGIYAHEACAAKIRERAEPVDLAGDAFKLCCVVLLAGFAVTFVAGPFAAWLFGIGG